MSLSRRLFSDHFWFSTLVFICGILQDGERVPSYTSKVEPVTGDKRQREDNDQNGTPHPSSRSTRGPTGESNIMNSYMSGSGQAQSMSGNDSLYIGDLQWVGCPVGFLSDLLKPMLLQIHSVDNGRRFASSRFELWR